MSLPILILVIATAFSSSAFALVVTRLDPHNGVAVVLTFFATLFLLLTSLFTLAIFGIRVWWRRNEIYFRNLTLAFREGALLAGAVSVLLFLQAYRYLTWWSALLIVIVVALIETVLFATLPGSKR